MAVPLNEVLIEITIPYEVAVSLAEYLDEVDEFPAVCDVLLRTTINAERRYNRTTTTGPYKPGKYMTSNDVCIEDYKTNGVDQWWRLMSDGECTYAEASYWVEIGDPMRDRKYFDGYINLDRGVWVPNVAELAAYTP